MFLDSKKFKLDVIKSILISYVLSNNKINLYKKIICQQNMLIFSNIIYAKIFK